MNIFITYSDEKYAEARQLCARMARRVGRFDKVVAYTPEDIDEDFKRAHIRTFSVKRGAGLWLWKPYLLQKTLNEIARTGDVVFYCDAGTFFIRSFSHLLKTMEQDVWVSNIPLAEKQYTKRETFVRMGCEGVQYEDTAQVQGGFVGIRKSIFGMEFVAEWLRYASDYRILSSNTNPDYPEAPYFIAHREDQSILSLLSKKYGIVAHCDPTQYGRFPEKLKRPQNVLLKLEKKEEYPVVILLHRRPKNNIKVFLVQYVHVVLPPCVLRRFLSKAYYQ